MTPRGLYSTDSDGRALLLSGPFEVLAETRNEHGDGWGVLVAWRDHDGRRHEWAMPRSQLAGDGTEVRARLLDGGLYVAPSHKAREPLMSYFATVRARARARSVDRLGWYGSTYLLPDGPIGASGDERVVLQTAAPVRELTNAGTLEGWQDDVAALAVGNSRLVLSLCAAFAGPLLHLVGEETFGLHLSGPSSIGKTTLLYAAASVWGIEKPDTWRATDNGAEALAAGANDGFLALDELSQVDARIADAVVYMLGGNIGKARMRRDTRLRPSLRWRMVFLSSGEVGLSEKLSEAGKRTRAGLDVRLIDVPAEAGGGHGVFEDLHGHANGAAFANHLRAALADCRGHAIRAFLERITANPPLRDALKQTMAQWRSQHLPPGADGQVVRVAEHFALLATAGDLAATTGVLPWPKGEAERAVASCFRAWIERRDGTGPAEVAAGIAQVRVFIERHGASRFTPIEKGVGAEKQSATINRAGFRRRDPDDRWEYLVLPGAWRAEVCQGFDAKALARELVKRGLMIPGRGGRLSRTERVPGFGKPRVYVLRAAILADEIND